MVGGDVVDTHRYIYQFIETEKYILMGCEKEASTTTGAPPQEKKKLKICCACPETKAARDACVIEKGTWKAEGCVCVCADADADV